MSLTRRTLGLALAALAASAPLGAIAQSASQSLSSESVIETIKQNGVIRVGLSVFVPWAMRDLNGDLVGFEIDVAKQLADDMGVDVEFMPTSWDGIIPALLGGNFDVIISGMSITPERNLTVNFTEPYAYSGLTVLANKEMTKGFTLEDFNSPDVTFASRRGGTPSEVITQLFPKAHLLQFDEDGASTQEVLNGNAHATMGAEPTPSTEVRRYPDVLYVPFSETFLATGESFALRKGDVDALNFFNNWIAVHTRSGWLKERNDYWFKGDEWSDQVAQQ